MIELAREAFSGLLPTLLGLPINHLFVRAVLERCVEGWVWVDDVQNPALVHVIHPYGMTLLFGDTAAVSKEALSQHLHVQACSAADRWMQIFPANQAPRVRELLQAEVAEANSPPAGPKPQQFTRANFRFDAGRYAAKEFSRQAPEGLTLRPMTEADFALAGLSVSPPCFWRDAQQFLQGGGGWCVAQGKEVAAMAFASFRFGNELEIGVETRSDFRRRGLAQIAAAALIDACLAQRLEPVWACRKENLASYALAQRLGFVPSAEIPYFRLPALASR